MPNYNPPRNYDTTAWIAGAFIVIGIATYALLTELPEDNVAKLGTIGQFCRTIDKRYLVVRQELSHTPRNRLLSVKYQNGEHKVISQFELVQCKNYEELK